MRRKDSVVAAFFAGLLDSPRPSFRSNRYNRHPSHAFVRFCDVGFPSGWGVERYRQATRTAVRGGLKRLTRKGLPNGCRANDTSAASLRTFAVLLQIAIDHFAQRARDSGQIFRHPRRRSGNHLERSPGPGQSVRVRFHLPNGSYKWIREDVVGNVAYSRADEDGNRIGIEFWETIQESRQPVLAQKLSALKRCSTDKLRGILGPIKLPLAFYRPPVFHAQALTK